MSGETIPSASAGDPQEVLRAEVHRRAMDAIAREMAITLTLTSGSSVVTESRDLSCSVLDESGEQIGYAGWVAIHISTSLLGVAAVRDAYEREEIHPGDAFIVNDPHTSGALHEGDVGLIMPYFHEGELIAWGYVNEHMLDVGGSGVSGFAPGARDCYSEGLRFPALRIMRDDVLDRDWLRFFANNVRASATVINDLRSMIAALHTGRQRLAAALAEFGLAAHRRYCATNQRLSEEMVRARIAELPDGSYESVDWVEYDGDGDDRLHELGCELVVDGSELTLRFWGVPQIAAPVNGARPAILGQGMCTLQTTLLHDVPANGGLWRPVHFDLGPPGTIVNAVPPAAVCFAHSATGFRVDKVVRDALSQAMSLSASPRIRGRVAGQPCSGVVLVTLAGVDRSSGRTVVIFPISPTVPLGGPAQSTGDGLDTYSNTCNLGKRMAAVEMDEATTPLLILWRRIEPDSGGAGITRGGMGMHSAMQIRGSSHMHGTVSNNVSRVPPRGAGGGMPGGCTEYQLLTVTGTPRSLAQHAHLSVDEGEVFVIVNGGGGGLGDPLLRDPALIEQDIADGYVTAAAAAAVHGAVVTPAGTVDVPATIARRRAIRSERIGEAPACDPLPLEEVEAGVAVRASAGRWRCGYCAGDLGPLAGNYRDACVSARRPVSVAFEELGMHVRTVEGPGGLELASHHCPACASCLRTDVVLAGGAMPPAPRLRALGSA
jgi:N-methylhydantoinase B